METRPTDTSKNPQLIFTLSLLTSTFWVLSQLVNVYYFTLSGAIFEVLWLPMLALLVSLPIIILIFLIKENFLNKSLYIYAFLILGITVIFLLYNIQELILNFALFNMT